MRRRRSGVVMGYRIAHDGAVCDALQLADIERPIGPSGSSHRGLQRLRMPSIGPIVVKAFQKVRCRFGVQFPPPPRCRFRVGRMTIAAFVLSIVALVTNAWFTWLRWPRIAIEVSRRVDVRATPIATGTLTTTAVVVGRGR